MPNSPAQVAYDDLHERLIARPAIPAAALAVGDYFRCGNTLFGVVTEKQRPLPISLLRELAAGAFNGGIYFTSYTIWGEAGKPLCMGRSTTVKRLTQRQFERLTRLYRETH